MNAQQTVSLNPFDAEGSCHAGLVADQLLENTLVFNTENGDIILTKRESEILSQIAAGLTNKQIAKRLSRSERTIEYHRNRLMRKLSAHNSAQLVRRAIVMGVI
jgi:DNA-binding NarL/FixJ family response regulator